MYCFVFFGGLPGPRFAGSDCSRLPFAASLDDAQNAPGARNARPERDADPGPPASLPGLAGILRAAAMSASASVALARARARFLFSSNAYASSGSALFCVLLRFRECFPRGVGDASNDINLCANPRTGDGGPSKSAFTSFGERYPAL